MILVSQVVPTLVVSRVQSSKVVQVFLLLYRALDTTHKNPLTVVDALGNRFVSRGNTGQ